MSKYIDLISLLPEEDKRRIENYIYLYGINKLDFMGLEKWLQNWSHSNQKLFKLLGNQFIQKIEYSYEKNRYEIESDFRSLLRTHPFRDSYHEFHHNVIVPLYTDDKISMDARAGFNHLTDLINFVEDKTFYGIKIKLDGKKCLQIPEGTKPMRAFQKIITYFKDEWKFEDFEDFRLKHSLILNDKYVRGKLCFSIHPLDFMTMSDNDSNWSSCMSWTDEGCYHIGTVEMMNSNNVMCCYLENDDSLYNFAKHGTHVDDPLFTWNNKLWRVLAYVTKDIIMAGKAYPYRNKELSIAVIDGIKKLAEDNLNWKYSFGPELYKDMQYINTTYAMDRAKNYLHIRPKKHNIIFDTKGMYNDMLNDHDTSYWCYRNKVNYNKVLSVSGKCPCLCCGESVIDYNEYDADEYNERFRDTGKVVCTSCLDDMFTCAECGGQNATVEKYNIFIDGQLRIMCGNCIEEKVRRCPDCGTLMYVNRPLFHYGNFDQFKTANLSDYKESIYVENGDPWSKDHLPDSEFLGCYVCPECGPKLLQDLEKITISINWLGGKRILYRNTVKSKDEQDKYLWNSLGKFEDDYSKLESAELRESYFIKE